ncbi:MAG: hypothetical protein HQ483_05620 [Rhodospirillales bacterium]|nr:hypothetical protein [Rhodospirillales bacterium]
MINTKRRLPFALAVAAIFLLGGCGVTEKVTDVFNPPPIPPCPENRILAAASELTVYREGDGRDLTDVDFEGRIDNMGLACLTKVDKKTGIGKMQVEVVFNFVASRGPANTTRKARYPYFISITDLNKNILMHEKYDIEVAFQGNQSKFTFRNQPNIIELDVSPDRAGKDYLIYGGFVLTREQLQLFQQRRKQTRG